MNSKADSLKPEPESIHTPATLANIFAGLIMASQEQDVLFIDREIAQAAIDISVPFVSAIGHAENVTLVEKVADRKFATPTALGNFLREIVEQVAEERIGSRARLAADLEQTYKVKIGEMDNRNKSLYLAKVNLEKQVSQAGRNQAKLLLAGIVIGIILGLFLVVMF